ncbi:MAG: flavin reductase family protein [Rikenellaceae bacterium]|nr:flavin reductase family protein [Rikenellaceae bacterium]
MKNYIVSLLAFATIATTACNGNNRSAQSADSAAGESRTLNREQVQAATFDELFRSIDIREVEEDLFTLVNSDFTVITSGTLPAYNSMIASWGGWGVMFDRPVTWCFLRSNRYTLQVIMENGTYTMSYFDEEYKGDIMLFGTRSGPEKMKEHNLTAVETPDGNITYKEAKIVIECSTAAITTVSPDDFRDEESRKFIVDAHTETGEYHKLVFGDITKVWVRK